MTLEAYLKGNRYPGRFLLAGNTEDGRVVAAYAIMGRSENSRNRIFTLEDGVLKTRPYAEAKVEDPSLIIYNAGLTLGKYFILTNGDQTDTIKEELEKGRTFASALARRTYEPDSPNFTSRISALFNIEDGTSSLSIIRKKGEEAERIIWNYPVQNGKAHVIHTYNEDGNPLPAFSGSPKQFDIPSDIDELASLLWFSLDEENRISLYVRIGEDERVINRHGGTAKTEKLELKYGCNPNQKPAYVSRKGGLPITVENGRPGYINLLDALNGYQLVSELKKATGVPAAASFKHVSPAGAAIGLELDEVEKQMYFVTSKTELSPLATAYIRARGADRMSSFGDFIALSDICDRATAKAINREVSDGVIAPGYTPEALEILKAKRNGSYTVLSIDPEYVPDELELRTVFGITFTQAHNNFIPSAKDFENIVTQNKEFTPEAVRDLTVALITLKYTQSNSVCYAYRGQSIGVGAGQQSRIHCTRLAGSKASLWFLRHSERVLSLPFKKELSRNDKDNVIEQYLSDDPEEDVVAAWDKYFSEPVAPFTQAEKRAYLDTVSGVSLASDAFFPFSDNIDRAHKIGVKYISEPGGSVRDDAVIEAADKYDMVMAFTGVRLFHH